MSTPRAAVSVTAQTAAFLRTVAFSTTSTTVPCSRHCQHVLRRFSTARQLKASSKREMQTSTVFKPYSLTQPPPLPRNANIPETSIASPSSLSAEAPAGQPRVDLKPQIAIREQEAQKPKPVSAQPSAAPAAKPRPKLRPRKAAMKLTPGAVAHLRQLLDQPEPRIIKVGVKNKGCSGLAYDLQYVEKPGVFDEMVEQDGVKVLIDSKALMSIIGSEMDWVEDKLNQRFVFRNPNIKEQCGCGESFMV